VVQFAERFHWSWRDTLDLTLGQAFDYVDELKAMDSAAREPTAAEQELASDFTMLDMALGG
jgi:hypothetical protein